jgi:4-hydroxybenzoate polyprenyltransferase
LSKFLKTLFYGNIYLGICAVALCMETNLLSHVSLNAFPFYILIFFCTCIYYTMIYARARGAQNYNERTLWYRSHFAVINKTLQISTFLVVFFVVILVIKNRAALAHLSLVQAMLIVIFPLVAAWYTYSPRLLHLKKIRQTGWLKPFIVGLIWSGWVTVYPVIIWQLQMRHEDADTFPSFLLWLQNFLFFSIIAIIFDLKDYRTDFKHRLKTYPVIFGVRNTFSYIIVPATVVNLVVFFLFQRQQSFSTVQTIIQFIPYALLICVLSFYKQHRSLLYYLVIVDGLVFVKALCGISSVLFFKK